jgi:hemerythrin
MLRMEIGNMTQWTNTYSVGVPQFDVHHKQLFQFINDLHEAMKTGHAKERMARTLQNLIGYTQMHFNAEEEAMISANYPQFAVHKAEHDKFRAKVNAFQKDFEAGVAAISVELMEFLNGWLVNHIMKTDKQYGPVLAGKA